jgi:hypothetical protein
MQLHAPTAATNNDINYSTMKNHTKRFGLWTALLVLSATAASAVPAFYQVDMSVQMALGNFNPGAGDTLEAAGTFTTPDWSVFDTLTVNATNSNIYEGTFNGDQAPGAFENHKFIINVGGTGATRNWETIGNRFFQIPATATNLGVVFFNDVTSANSLITIQVKFQVNMGVQIALGHFVPATDFMYVAGDMNNWVVGTTLSASLADTNIYEVTLPVTNTVNATVNYKFIMNTSAQGQTWENNGVGPNGAMNRQFVFPNSDTNLEVAFFNNITNSSSLVVEPVTFTLNTAVQHALGNFDPSVGTISVAGDTINNWSPTVSQLTQTPTNADLWVGTFSITNTPGGAVNYKFVMNSGATWENNGVGPGNANDRQFIFTNAVTALSGVFFNNLGDLGALSITNVSGKLLSLSWTGGPNIRLQSAATLGAWQDVDNTAGLSTTTVTNDTAAKYLRLIGP